MANSHAVELVDDVLAGRASFKQAGPQLEAMPPDSRASRRVIQAHRFLRCESWLAAYLLGCIGHLAGYGTAKGILLNDGTFRSHASYASVAMAKMRGLAAYDDLHEVLFGDYPPQIRRGAVYGMVKTSSPRLLDDLLEAFTEGRLSRSFVAHFLADCSPSDEWLMALLGSDDAVRQKLACAIVEWLVLATTEQRLPGRQVAERVRDFVDDQAFGMMPTRRKRLKDWLDSQ